MNPTDFILLVLGLIAGGVVITGIYVLMLAVPQSDDEHLHDSISEPGHFRADLLRKFARLRRKFLGQR